MNFMMAQQVPGMLAPPQPGEDLPRAHARLCEVADTLKSLPNVWLDEELLAPLNPRKRLDEEVRLTALAHILDDLVKELAASLDPANLDELDGGAW